MAPWRKKKDKNQQQRLQEGDPVGYTAVVSLIRTRLDIAASMEELKAMGLVEVLAARYLDLAMVIAARQVLQTMEGVVLPVSYAPVIEIPGLPLQFGLCRISEELVGVYQIEPTAAALLAPLAADFVNVNQALQQGEQGVRVWPARVGDGSQVSFARSTFGDAAVLKLAESWPTLS